VEVELVVEEEVLLVVVVEWVVVAVAVVAWEVMVVSLLGNDSCKNNPSRTPYLQGKAETGSLGVVVEEVQELRRGFALETGVLGISCNFWYQSQLHHFCKQLHNHMALRQIHEASLPFHLPMASRTSKH